MPKAMLPSMMGIGAGWCGGCPEIWKNMNAEIAKMTYPTINCKGGSHHGGVLEPDGSSALGIGLHRRLEFFDDPKAAHGKLVRLRTQRSRSEVSGRATGRRTELQP
jgi:hypothetical protein